MQTIEQIEKEIRLKINNLYATVFSLSGYDRKQLKEKEDLLIEDIRSKIIELIEGVKEIVGDYEKTNEIYKRYNRQYNDEFYDGLVVMQKEVLTNLNNLLDNIKK